LVLLNLERSPWFAKWLGFVTAHCFQFSRRFRFVPPNLLGGSNQFTALRRVSSAMPSKQLHIPKWTMPSNVYVRICRFRRPDLQLAGVFMACCWRHVCSRRVLAAPALDFESGALPSTSNRLTTPRRAERTPKWVSCQLMHGGVRSREATCALPGGNQHIGEA